MKIQGTIRLVAFGLLAMLPTITGQGRRGCTAAATECRPGNCCKDNGRCSESLGGSLEVGETARDACECISGSAVDIDGTILCACIDDDDCADETCCNVASQCSTAPAASLGGGVSADDACECISGILFDRSGLCGCNEDIECTGALCCRRNSRCSDSDSETIAPGEPAVDACECISLSLNNADGICECTDDSQCTGEDECCPLTEQCEDPATIDPIACGEDGKWYALISELPSVHINMRVTAPVYSLPEITYITGLSVLTTDDEGFIHSMVISVKDPHSLESACPMEQSVCLADGALSIILDGKEALVAPGMVTLAPGVELSAANIPGECRSFGFEKYWERKKMESQGRRRLQEEQNMGDWILGDPTVTNMVECIDYVAAAMLNGNDLFDHQSEHASFRIVTPTATIRLSHGRLHQLAMRDPTDQYDLPDHLTWQMNMAIDHASFSRDAQGIIGETFVPTLDDNGDPIMTGMESIRGQQNDYYVEGPLDVVFAQATFSS